MSTTLAAATRLHRYLVDHHWDGKSLVGPDPGIRFNARAGRFLKSYLRSQSWSDHLVYQQAQGYWVLDNWLLFDLLEDDQYHQIALACCESILELQSPEGYWAYPNPEWKGRIATTEGCYGALGLLEGYERSKQDRFLQGALAWYDFLQERIGFRRQSGGFLATNYFADAEGGGGGVPNVSTLVLWLLARLATATDDDRYLENAEPIVGWLHAVQAEDGELPYHSDSSSAMRREHFLCYQYNAFQFADLAGYWRLTGDAAIWPLLTKLAGFLEGGIVEAGHARHSCENSRIEVTYYTAAVANALSLATTLGIGDYRDEADLAFTRTRELQLPDGGFQFYSRANYGFLSDKRSYPRYLAMILRHLLLEARREAAAL